MSSLPNGSVENKELKFYNKTLEEDKPGINFILVKLSQLGTLVGNWWEERELRNATGVGRTIPYEHFPKNHGDLFRKPLNEVDFILKRRSEEKLDDTNERILGKKNNLKFNSENSE